MADKDGVSRQIEAWQEASRQERISTAVACWLGSLTLAGGGQWLSGRTIRAGLWLAGELGLISLWLLTASRTGGWVLATATGVLVGYHLAGWVDGICCGWRFRKVKLGSSVSRVLVMAVLVFGGPLPAVMLVYWTQQVWPVQEYVVSEGSMAPALLGQHVSLRCPACDYKFPVDLYPWPRDDRMGEELGCPMCGNNKFGTERAASLRGDRILSSKRLMPGRWDLLLFRSPMDLQSMILKRVIGLEGEELEIIDGEIFVNSILASKPALGHEEMWLAVSDTKFRARNTHRPRLQWRTAEDTKGWQMDRQGWSFKSGKNGRESLELVGKVTDQLVYNFNSLQYIEPVPVHDIRLRVRLAELQGEGTLSLVWEREGSKVTGSFQTKGEVSLEVRRAGQDQAVAVQGVSLDRAISDGAMLMLIVRDGYAYLYLGRKQVCEAAVGPFEAGAARNSGRESCRVRITAENCRGNIGQIRLDRDVHYRSVDGRATKIGAGNYYVLGDNSAISSDSRLGWLISPGLAGWYEPRTVPAEFVEGVVTCVYWPLGRIRSLR